MRSWSDLTTAPAAAQAQAGPAPRRSRALALFLAIALVSTPLSAALRADCDLCPHDCPMHVATARESGRDRATLGCHHARRGTSRDQDSHTPRFSRPKCGNHANTSAISIPVILTDPSPVGMEVRVAAPPARDRTAHSRTNDPPDTPPPIFRG
jgi:hypothetical protein